MENSLEGEIYNIKRERILNPLIIPHQLYIYRATKEPKGRNFSYF